MVKKNDLGTPEVSESCVATKVCLQLSTTCYTELAGSLLNERTLNSDWIDKKGWLACHSSDSDMMGFTATSLIRYCRMQKIRYLYAAESLEVFRSYGGLLTCRCVPLNLVALDQVLYASEKNCKSLDDYEFILAGAYSSLIFFSPLERLPFLIMRDFSTCVTIAGPKMFIERMIALSKKTWFDGVPFDGSMFSDARVRRAAISRRECLSFLRSDIEPSSTW